MKKRIAAWLAFCLVWTCLGAALAQEQPTPAAHPTAKPGEGPVEGTLRVLLQSLGTRNALGLTLAGSYTVDGDRGFQFDPGTEVALGLAGGHITLKVGGAAIDMGSGFTLERHIDDTGAAGGIYIHESEKNTLYCGDITFTARNDSIRVLVTMNVEDYLYGVVAYEMNELFPLEALKAQAVAARTYAMQRKARNAASDYDVVDTANDQVFKGFDGRYERIIQAVDETRGVVGMYNGTYAECFYSASNGGQTALATDVWGKGDFPYFDIRDDPYDLANPQSVVKTATIGTNARQMNEALYGMLVREVGLVLQDSGVVQAGEAVGLAEVVKVEAVEPVYGGGSRQYGTIRFTIKPAVRHLLGEPTDAIRMLGEEIVLDEAVEVDLSYYTQVRSALGISINSSKYDMVTVTETEDGFLLTARRYGHGVGMSQRGAEWMAKEYGMHYLEILSFYYPGLELVQQEWIVKELTHADALPESLGYAAPRPTPAPTPAPLPALQEGEYYATVVVQGVDGTLNVREGPSTEFPLVGMIRNAARLIVEEETAEGWAKMKTAELEGYVSMDFIVKE